MPPIDSCGLDELAMQIRSSGDVLRRGRTIMFAHPDAIRDIFTQQDRKLNRGPQMIWGKLVMGNGLLTSNGELHRKQRALIQPALHPKRIGHYSSVAIRHAIQERDSWQNGEVIEVHSAMMRLTLKVMAEALFGAAVGPAADSLAKTAELTVLAFARALNAKSKMHILLPTPFNIRFALARQRLRATLRRFISDRRHGSAPPADDLLARLLGNQPGPKPKPLMSERQLLDECVTLFSAGHETTASALTFSLWLLAYHPEHQTIIRDELDDVLGDRAAPSEDDLEKLVYTRMVAAESMRFLPPVYIQGRRVEQACQIAGEPVRAGDEVGILQWVTHRDERWWPDPLRFDPLRFSPANIAFRPRWAYFPFGGGQRACVGEPFAWSEIVLCLATLLRQWWIEPGDNAPLLLQPGVSLRPKNTVRLTVRR